MLIGLIIIIQNIGPELVCVRGCDIARACEGYITSEDTKQGSYMKYTGPISILHTIYCMMVTSPAQCAHGGFVCVHHIKGMMSPSYIYNLHQECIMGKIMCSWPAYIIYTLFNILLKVKNS